MFLGYTVSSVRFFSSCHKSSTNFLVYLLEKKKTVHKWTFTVQTHIFQGLTIFILELLSSRPKYSKRGIKMEIAMMKIQFFSVFTKFKLDMMDDHLDFYL